VHPDRQPVEEEEGLGLSVAIGFRYAFGRGDTLGLSVPATYDPSSIVNTPIATTVHEIGLNFAAKVAF
jgi:hypothetical protein